METIIRNKKEHYEVLYQEKSKQYNRLANFRLLVLLLGLFTTYQWIQNGRIGLWAGLSSIAYVGFFILIKQHQKVKEEVERFEALIKVNEKYLARLTQDWQNFKEDGAEFLEQDHPYSFDLDIVGPRSLYQKINTTHTWYGKHKLAESLLRPSFSETELLQRQKAVSELMHNLDFCQHLESTKQKKMASNPEKMIAYATRKETFFTKPWMKPYTQGMTIVTLGILGLSIGLSADVLGVLATLLLGGNLIVQYAFIGRITEAKGLLSTLVYDLQAYTRLLEQIEAQTFYSEHLVALKSKLFNKQHTATEAIKQLERLSNRANISYQPIAAIVLNATVLWDLQTMIALESWKRTYGTQMQMYLETMGEIESLVSFAVLGHIEAQTCFPLIESEGKTIEGTQLGHPLIAPKGRVTNDVTMKEAIFIITGSNMSGKTTFLRTIGMQLVLAYAGAPVVAKDFKCSRMGLYTSMRIRDDLSEGVSTFYAELTRIKQIVEASRSEKICFLIDEIFRGTNSVDRIIGAKSVLKGLQHEGAIGGMTTHDLEICQLAEPNRILNYHFTESYEADHIQFDYKLKDGASTTTNAKYLMRRVGIEVID